MSKYSELMARIQETGEGVPFLELDEVVEELGLTISSDLMRSLRNELDAFNGEYSNQAELIHALTECIGLCLGHLAQASLQLEATIRGIEKGLEVAD